MKFANRIKRTSQRDDDHRFSTTGMPLVYWIWLT